MKPKYFLISLWILFSGTAFGADKAAAFFDDSKVQEIRITFSDANWYNTLYQAHSGNTDDPYFPARFQWGDTVIDSIGVRFKGNSSFRAQGVKKSFKLDFNEYQDDAAFLGLKKLNLNNGDLQPDLLREKMFLDFASKYIAAMRAVHCRLYVNDVYYGLYVAVEQIDKTMMQSRFGDNEDGNLYQAGESNADLKYLGTLASAYSRYYTLETNETENDWSDLIEFLNVLNNTAAADLPKKLQPICDVDNMLYGLALNALFTNLDSYIGSASEFYLYDRTDTERFIHLHWDLNEGFGTTGDGSPKLTNPFIMDPFYLPASSTGGGPGGGGMTGGSRPLAEKLWAVPSYKRTYLRLLARMLREGFDTTTMDARIQSLANLIRNDVYADPNKIYTNEQFETSLTAAISRSQVTVYGVLQFIRERYNYLRPLLTSYAETTDIRLNELMTRNTKTLKDGAGDYDPWLEVHNLGPGTVSLKGFYLTDDMSNPSKWALPDKSTADGEYVVLWLDGETGEGTDHNSFQLQTGGGSLYLYYVSGSQSTLIDSVTYPTLESNQSWIRIGNRGEQWLMTTKPTAGTDNPSAGTNISPGTGLLRINEFLAVNDTNLEDPQDPGKYDDWIEVYNPGTAAVDMSGMFLTDNMANPTKWQVPQGVGIPAGGYLIFWADADVEQGNLHTDFQLDTDGEELALYAADGTTLIDSVVFPAQSADVSYGRKADNLNEWIFFSTPTPGKVNQGTSWASSVTLAIAKGGAAEGGTSESTTVLQTGYATVTVNSGSTPYGTAVFSFSHNNMVVNEVGVPASPPTTAARIFLDYRTGVTVSSGQGTSGTIDIVTGLAITNPGEKSSDITYTLRAIDGTLITTGHGTLAAGAHVARFVHQLKEIAADFNLPGNFDTAVGYGSLEIRGTQALSILALRMTVNEREEILLTATPVADLTQSASTAPLYFPQLADGGGFATTLILMNTGSTTEKGVVKIYADDGNPLVVGRTGGSSASSHSYSIASQGVYLLETEGSSTSTRAGWVQVVPEAGSTTPVGAGIFRYRQNGVVVTESGVPSALSTTRARIYVDRSSGHNTGLAVSSPGATAATISLRALGTDGKTVSGTGSVTLPGNGHRAAFVEEMISGIAPGFVGVMDLESSVPFVALTLRSLTNGRNDFLLTTLPIADLTRTAPTPILFPHIADGSGYCTQFILLSAGEAAEATIKLFNDSGSPLAILR